MLTKYPRTPHLAGSRLQPGDEDLSQTPFAEPAGRHLVVEEKLDGANISRQHRDLCIGLGAAYHARVEIVALEVPPGALWRQNAARPSAVPEPVIDRLIAKWEAPDITEAHTVRAGAGSRTCG
ncbi:ATP-binding protein [Paractinoplanes brasiliensis]|uniref:ATP-binding protein n=1 Tax=Paractinoplanes brasiliensis TaxID=52695 RepID=UPI001EF1A408|nr:ATP-binding protein [Actinoplanes brasiliensis]